MFLKFHSQLVHFLLIATANGVLSNFPLSAIPNLKVEAEKKYGVNHRFSIRYADGKPCLISSGFVLLLKVPYTSYSGYVSGKPVVVHTSHTVFCHKAAVAQSRYIGYLFVGGSEKKKDFNVAPGWH